MPTFNAGDIIGKTLIAKKNVQLKRIAADNAPVIFNVSPGDVVGIVDSYLMPSSERSELYWTFLDSNNKPYYASHSVGKYDVKELQSQGALTLQEQQQAAQQAAMTTGDKIFQLIRNLAIGAAIIYLGKQIIDKKL